MTQLSSNDENIQGQDGLHPEGPSTVVQQNKKGRWVGIQHIREPTTTLQGVLHPGDRQAVR